MEGVEEVVPHHKGGGLGEGVRETGEVKLHRDVEDTAAVGNAGVEAVLHP